MMQMMIMQKYIRKFVHELLGSQLRHTSNYACNATRPKLIQTKPKPDALDLINSLDSDSDSDCIIGRDER